MENLTWKDHVDLDIFPSSFKRFRGSAAQTDSWRRESPPSRILSIINLIYYIDNKYNIKEFGIV